MNIESYEKIIKDEKCTHIVFWKYDQYPYVIGSPGKDLEILNDCRVTAYVPMYQGRFYPIYKTDDLERGLSIVSELHLLKKSHESELASLNDEYMKKLNVLPFTIDMGKK